MSPRRTFLVHVLADGVVVEDVASGAKALAADLGGIVAHLAAWMEDGGPAPARDRQEPPCGGERERT